MLTSSQEQYVLDHIEETRELLRTLGKIPAPSHEEDKRAAFVKDWFEKAGAKGVYIDSAKNVIWPASYKASVPVSLVAAHTDIVFPDTDTLIMKEEDGKLYAPGIGDDTANLVNLMMACKYYLEAGLTFSKCLVIAANSCEEGLGNLDGSRQLMKDFGQHMSEFISLDGGMTGIVCDAVGSERFRIHVQAEGGHSFFNFGNQNAIVQMAALITDLYRIEIPALGKTTCNVGHIEGGTTVNSIAEECEILYEFRSDSREALRIMEESFNRVIESHREKGIDVTVDVMGIRPCKGDVPEEREEDLLGRVTEILSRYTDKTITRGSGSTDCNIPLSLGVPAACYGTYRGAGAHTRGEWIEFESLKDGQRIALETLAMYL